MKILIVSPELKFKVPLTFKAESRFFKEDRRLRDSNQELPSSA